MQQPVLPVDARVHLRYFILMLIYGMTSALAYARPSFQAPCVIASCSPSHYGECRLGSGALTYDKFRSGSPTSARSWQPGLSSSRCLSLVHVVDLVITVRQP